MATFKETMNYVKDNRFISQQGVGLIEILITLFILAVGLLGVAALQFTGSFANKDAISRTQAELVASQVAERLRAAARPATVGNGMVANNAYFNDDSYNFSTLSCKDSGQPYESCCLTRPANIPNCESNTCSELQMAQYDGWSLSCSAVQTNPQTKVAVSCDDNNGADIYSCSTGSRIEVMLTWPVASSSTRQYTKNTRCNPDTDDSNACVVKDITL
jgi:type IV pilus assembly protein PilV